jgi:hypothetical protein
MTWVQFAEPLDPHETETRNMTPKPLDDLTSVVSDSNGANRQGEGNLPTFMESLTRPSFLLSLVASSHFSISVLLFFVGVLLEYYNHRQDLVWKQWLWDSVPAVFLTVLSFGASIVAWRYRRLALPWVAVLYVTAGLTFSYDVWNKRAQLSVSVASREYWRGGGEQHTYLTWWWFNDSWFRRDDTERSPRHDSS